MSMKVAVVCSDSSHPIFPYLKEWTDNPPEGCDINLVTKAAQLDGGDLLLLVSCTEMIPRSIASRFSHALVIHESDLPHGRGWSPLAWQVSGGKNDIVVSLIAATDKVDRGAIWKKAVLHLDGHELIAEITLKLFAVKKDLMEFAIRNAGQVIPEEQREQGASYYPRRTAEDSRIDPNRTIAEQFDLLRIVDNSRYPAFFDLRGHRYKLAIEDLGTAPPASKEPG